MKDLHKFWKHRWLTPKAKVFRSEIFDYGPFAIKNIKKGELIRVTGGLVVPRKDIKKFQKIWGFAAEIQIDDSFFLCPSSHTEARETGLFNHSCDPNVGLLDSIRIIAIRDIKKGEELTLDYAFFGGVFSPFKCNCGSKNCRKIITPNDWKMKEIQQKYGEYFSPYLKEKIFKTKILQKDKWIKNSTNQKLLAEMWGNYIDWEKRREGENGWLVKQLKRFNCQKIFDSALGDGCDSIYLIKEGFDVTSNDIDEAFIKKAKENAKRENVRLKVLKLDWRSLTKKIPKESFDAVLCLGNSLTCLLKYKDRLAALKQFWAILKKKGILILDKRHYCPVLDNRERVLKGYFHYSGKYVYCGKHVHSKPVEIREDKIIFEIYDERTGKKAYFTGCPFTHWELIYFLKNIGFSKIKEYSDYQIGYNPKADFFMYICQK